MICLMWLLLLLGRMVKKMKNVILKQKKHKITIIIVISLLTIFSVGYCVMKNSNEWQVIKNVFLSQNKIPTPIPTSVPKPTKIPVVEPSERSLKVAAWLYSVSNSISKKQAQDKFIDEEYLSSDGKTVYDPISDKKYSVDVYTVRAAAFFLDNNLTALIMLETDMAKAQQKNTGGYGSDNYSNNSVIEKNTALEDYQAILKERCQKEKANYSACLSKYSADMSEYSACVSSGNRYCFKPSNYCVQPVCSY